MKQTLLLAFALLTHFTYAQNDSIWNQYRLVNSIDQAPVGAVKISGYAQIDYNQGFANDTRMNGKMDVHRMVMLFAYKFNPRTSFVTEIEFEHVSEVFIEQAFVKYKLKPNFFLKAGLILVPMGITNEVHEPTTFFSVERPNLDSKIVPTTWREMAAGITGVIPVASMKYQLYVVNGLLGYDGDARFGGSNGVRSGRQKGAKTVVSSPNISAKVNYFGQRNLNIGLAVYLGESQSTAFNGLDMDDIAAVRQADSTVVRMNMVGLDARYQRKGLIVRGQANILNNNNTVQYNEMNGSDLAKTLMGFYIETGYNVLENSKFETQLIPFVRYEQYNVHHEVEGIDKNMSYNAEELIAGINWKPSTGVVFKGDVQLVKRGNENDFTNILNLGIGIWF